MHDNRIHIVIFCVVAPSLKIMILENSVAYIDRLWSDYRSRRCSCHRFNVNRFVTGSIINYVITRVCREDQNNAQHLWIPGKARLFRKVDKVMK